MTRDEAVARIQRGLGFRTDKADEIVLALQEEQRDLEKGKTLPQFLISQDQTLTLLAGENAVALPDDFLRRTNNKLRYVPATETVREVRIGWRNYDELRNAYAFWSARGPLAAAIRQGEVYFSPTSDRDYTVTWDYYAKAEVLTTNIENLWLEHAPELLIGGAGVRIAMDLRNKAATELFSTMYARAAKATFNETVEAETDDELILGANN